MEPNLAVMALQKKRAMSCKGTKFKALNTITLTLTLEHKKISMVQ
jgi:hypothetical protein